MYDARQRTIIAYAVALAGFNVASAARWLKDHTVEVGAVGETTLRRFLTQPAFQALVAEQAKIVKEESETATRLAERERLRRARAGRWFEDRAALCD